MLLFVLSVGLSVTLGLMNFVNLAHGAFGMLGGYVAVTAMRQLGLPFLAALPLAFLAAALLSVVFERTLFRRLYRAGELNQVLFTIGLVFVAAAARRLTSSAPASSRSSCPPFCAARSSSAGMRFGVYRIFLIAVALLITAPALLRAGAHALRRPASAPPSTTSAWREGLGLDVDRIFAVTFALGSGLAGLGGALAIEIVGLDPSFGFHYLVYVLIVVAGRRPRLDRRLLRRRGAARHRRRRGQIFRAPSSAPS